MDKNAITLGLQIGRILAGQRRTRKQVAYLYNGVRLPALPEWDRSAYPYAVISHRDANTVYSLYYMSKPITCSESGNLPIGLLGTPQNDSEYISYKIVDGAWVEGTDNGLGVRKLDWTNVDLFYKEDAGGGLFMAGSEPVPVYE